MVRSMFAGVAGLRAHQSKMDVIGNNIANVNTWGYKAASMSFKDAMYQNSSSGSGGNTETGGIGAVNANQIGYGVTTGAITYDFSTGSMSPSASGLDCMIDGTGFFIVGPMLSGGALSLEGDDAVKSSGLYLSRVGKFKVDPNGYLTDDSGSYVYGFSYDQDTKKYATGSLVPLKLPTQSVINKLKNDNNSDAVTAAKKALSDAQATYNSQNAIVSAARQAYVTAQSNYQAKYDSIENAAGTIKGIGNIQADVDAKEAAMKTAYNDWKNATTDPGNTLRDAYYAKLKEYEQADYELIELKAQLIAPTAAKAIPSPDEYFTNYQSKLEAFRDADETLTTYEGIKKDYEDAKKALVDFKNKLSTLEDGSLQSVRDAAKITVSTEETKLEAAYNAVAKAQANLTTAQTTAASSSSSTSSGTSTDDALAEFASYKIQQDGTIVGTTANSETVTIGKIALGRVQNMGGLEKDSGYYYTVGASAGNVSVFEGGGTDGVIRSNFLEMAKVDLATEMTDMITTQRGFQANSKIITVTDQMLEELVNMKR
ncbi:flagellar hook-basal body complex protein [Lacrimispora defluvii]|uniref:Flagellar hook protein FlgE n=1 Tax=Lacrimispora defluvii TaxID=2719233 RepID=A0ABX1VVB2_9FIRM|nr:flagellar hook-basal body complex protein [Lacrimispora defluvii]NNJ31176.1 flagellar hook-basal body complex protein [Lacrimispora defluvii]